MATNNTSNALQGWTSSPDGRGTLDILWTCLTTILLSTWSAICLNIPEPSDTIWTHLKRKTWITLISIMGPEYLLGFALGEWQSARASVAHLKQLRQDDKWTIKHAFFADMGGFVLRTSDNVQFFLDTKHILWLLKHQVISTAEFEKSFLLETKAIDDRNKSDTFVRVIAVGQALWFCVNIITRGVQGLAVTTLEITTIGIIIDSIVVYYIWKDKPADVESIEIVDINLTLNEMLLLEEDEAARARPWFRTPLDFASREIWSFNLIYHHLMNILKGMSPRSWRREKKVSLGRRSENDTLPITGVAWVIAVFFTIIFMGTNFIAWNFHFPTSTERLLWQLSSCGLVLIAIIGLPANEMLYGKNRIKTMQERVQKYRKALEGSDTPGEKARWTDCLIYKVRTLAMKIRNNSLENDPNLDMSLFFVLAGVPVFAFYSLCRFYILVEDVISFRGLPADAYSTVDWWAFVPHVG
ncbi:Major facilitator superfamily domain general substrate transporter protein [Rutstroemia sp. NJR-2017a BBW]|nr:Major facilitator superfamily domain general substrate transporter protein [Rutstroemia sp. NJR-2017a BBW]